jgi:hypothetical protein
MHCGTPSVDECVEVVSLFLADLPERKDSVELFLKRPAWVDTEDFDGGKTLMAAANSYRLP